MVESTLAMDADGMILQQCEREEAVISSSEEHSAWKRIK